MASSVDSLVERLRSVSGVRVEESSVGASVSAIGGYPAIGVGPRQRCVTVVCSGPIRHVSDPDYVDGLRVEPADATVVELAEELQRACKREGVSLWYGHEGVGIGCWHLYDAGSRWSRLAEEIRVTRIRALDRPGVGHEARLEELTAAAGASA